MKYHEVKTGMKVVPHSKSVLSYISTAKGLKSSNCWSRALAKGQPFLYVVGEEKEPLLRGISSCFLLNPEQNAKSGDFYLASDFDLYTEEKGVTQCLK